MAAHILRILSEIEREAVRPELVKHALGYAPACDSLTYDHWERLNSACDTAPAEVQKIARDIIPDYTALFFTLGAPETCEAWRKAENDHLQRLGISRDEALGIIRKAAHSTGRG